MFQNQAFVVVKRQRSTAFKQLGYGFANDLPMQRYLRDVRFTLIGGGTSEILKSNIAKGLQQ